MATMTTGLKRSHQFHAEAHVLSGELHRPVQQKIEPHVPVALRDERGGHLTRFTEDVSIEGLITFKTGHTRVSGSKSLKHKGWVTLSTSILEGYNVFEVITADRVVAQVSTDHPYENGHVPHVTFLGTKFDNLQVGGFPIQPTLNLGVCGEKPKDDKSYLETPAFLNKIREQVASIAGVSFLPESVQKQYDDRLKEIDKIIDLKGAWKTHHQRIKVTCSVVENIDIKGIPIPGLKTVGNVLVIPHFGAVALGELEVGLEQAKFSNEFGRHEGEPGPSNGDKPKLSSYFELTMLKMDLGCFGHGTANGPIAAVNGHDKP